MVPPSVLLGLDSVFEASRFWEPLYSVTRETRVYNLNSFAREICKLSFLKQQQCGIKKFCVITTFFNRIHPTCLLLLFYNFLPKSAAFFSKVTMIDSNIANSESWVFIRASNSWRRRWISLSLTSIWCLRLDRSDCNASFFFPEFSAAAI